MELRTIGIDPGKTVFHLVGLNLRARLWFARSSRASNCRTTVNLQVELLGMEACGGAHHLK